MEEEEENFAIELNMTDMVKEWIRVPKKYHGIMIRASHKDEDLVDRVVDANNQSSVSDTRLSLFQTLPHACSSAHLAAGRPALESGPGERRNCRRAGVLDRPERKPLLPVPLESNSQRTRAASALGKRALITQVDFEAMGWDWIVSPKRYDAFYCAGECPYRYRQGAAHTHLTQQAEAAGAGAGTSRRPQLAAAGAGPCCAPLAYRPLKLIYVSKAGTVHERSVENMMVSKCICI